MIFPILLVYMEVQEQINDHIASLPSPKRADMQTLHQMILAQASVLRLWYLDGKNAEGKVVSNPNIGYGTRHMPTAKEGQREFYRVGISGNTTGISVYIMGIEDKQYLANTFGKDLGKASITGYCIKFKALKDINLAILEEVVRFGLGGRV